MHAQLLGCARRFDKIAAANHHLETRSDYLEEADVRIRDAKPEELAPKSRKIRALTPRQLAIQKRDQALVKVLNEIAVGPHSSIKKIELEDGENLITIRAAVARQLAAHPAEIRMGVRGGAIYLSRSAIPGGRGGRPRKNP